MPQHDKDKNKKQSKPGVKVPVQSKGLGTGKYRPPSDWSPWKSTGMGYEERTRKTPGDWKPRTTPGGKDFDRAFGEARRAGKKTFTWGGKTYTTNMAGGTEKEMRKVGEVKKPEKMTPMTPRKVDIPGVKSNREVGGKIPNVEKKHAAMYSKKYVTTDPDWKTKGNIAKSPGRMKTKGKGKALASYVAGKISPFHSARIEGKGTSGARVQVGKRHVPQSKVRHLTEKEATSRTGELKRGVTRTMPGGEKVKRTWMGGYKTIPTRTKGGVATENAKASKKEMRSGKRNLVAKKKKEQEAWENSSYRKK